MAHCLLCPLQCVKDVAKCIFTEALWPPVKRHIDYWWCFDGNVQGLRDQITNLEREMSNMNQKIEEARLDGKIPTTDVQNLSNEGTQMLEEAKRISRGCDDLKAWKICPRYSKGKSAKEKAEGIAKLRNEGNSIRIADPAPPAAMVPITHPPTLEFQSRKSIEEDIMKALKDGYVRMIALCGAGGVGKTTTAQRIEDRAIKEKLFDEVVLVVVSQQFDKLKIQKQIAEMLGLGLSQDTLAGRAHTLRTRLMDSKKKLIIFDDVWKSLELEVIGVPYGGCKIILTSRDKDVCEEMGANEVIEIKVLEKEEAWTLFREKSDLPIRIEDLYFRRTAKEVAEECKGLPLALATVGIALKNKRKEIWEDALLQLRRANPMNFPQLLEKVYKPLKLSYDFLESRIEKELFLLCCLFPEDHNINIENLALLGFGLGMFEGINKIEDGRNRTFNLLERLRSRFLLMTGGREDEVKMHDVVRDVAIFIGSKEKQGFLKSLEVCSMDFSNRDSSRNCNWMSVDISVANAKLPIETDFPNLRLLMVLNSNDIEYPEGFDVNDICFKGMEELTVLYFSYQNLQSLPSSLKFLKKLGKLHLDNCNVKDISVVAELRRLEILRIFCCNDIEEVPADVGELKLLRLLELRDCEKLERIVAGVISSLVGLEELKIVDCFDKWEAKGNASEERNASLSELESLRNLTSLEIDISDHNLVAKEILLSKHLRIYQIRFSKDRFLFYGQRKTHEKKIRLNFPNRDVTVGNWIRRLVKNTESLVLDGDGSNNFNLAEVESLRELVFQCCSTVKKLANAVDCKFPMLEHLKLRELIELEEIIDGIIPEGSNSFQNLQSLVVFYMPKLRYLWKSPNQNVNLLNLNSIDIWRCPNLRYLFSMATARSLVQLQSLEIYNCETMEQVLWNETESNTEASIIIEFPKLKKLKLWYLPNLLAFTKGVEIIKFPQLIQLEIQFCPKLRTKIDKFPTCTIEKLLVCNGDSTIEEIFGDDGNRHIIFQELYELQLLDLPCLTTFYRGVESIKFTKLKELRIGNLPRLNSFVAIDSEPTHDHHSLHFFCNEKVEMIGLKTLRLHDLPDKISKIWCRHIPITFFHNLEILDIFKVEGIRNLISSSIAKALVNLNTLNIKECKEMIDVIEYETDVTVNSVFPNLKYLKIIGNCKLMEVFRDDGNHHIIFQELYELELRDLPCLTTFYTGAESIKFPKLKKLWIENLPRLNCFVAIDSEPTHDHHSLHFFCNKKVEIIGLETLYIWNLPDKISKIWCRHIPITFFHNLEYLNIFQVDGITNLISSSIAKALVNLNILSIQYCKQMVDVIEDETGVIVNSVFPNLKNLSISHNCMLRSFCQWKHVFELPSLELVEIVYCPLMKTFTLGSLSTPKLHRISMNFKDIEMKDLNDGIHHFTSTEITKKDENKDEYSEDEDQKEIEGEEKIESSNNINLM